MSPSNRVCHHIDKRINNTVSIVKSNSENLRRLITERNVPGVRDNCRRVGEETGEDYAGGSDEEPAATSPGPGDDNQHGRVENQD